MEFHLISQEVREAINNLANAICQYEGMEPHQFIKEAKIASLIEDQITEIEMEAQMDRMAILEGEIRKECPWAKDDILHEYLMDRINEPGINADTFKQYFKEEVMG